MSEWNLSDKIAVGLLFAMPMGGSATGNFVPEEHVREFIKRLREELTDALAVGVEPKLYSKQWDNMDAVLDKLAGDKLC